MDRSRSTGSRSTEEKGKEVLVYHRRSVQEREAAQARRSVQEREAAQARKPMMVYHRRSFEEREAAEARRRAEAEAVEAMYKLHDSKPPSSAEILWTQQCTYNNPMERYQMLHEFMPSKIYKEVKASVLLLKMKRTLKS
jgi:hypothetical protein